MTAVAPLHFHLHPHCDDQNWVKKFSRYDAGWLHRYLSEYYTTKNKSEENILYIYLENINILK